MAVTFSASNAADAFMLICVLGTATYVFGQRACFGSANASQGDLWAPSVPQHGDASVHGSPYSLTLTLILTLTQI